MDNSGNSIAFFTSVMKMVDLYVEITKENIGFCILSQDARYKHLVKSIQQKSNNSKEKIYYISMASIVMMDPQKSENIGN